MSTDKLLQQILDELKHLRGFDDMNYMNMPHSDRQGYEFETLPVNTVLAAKGVIDLVRETKFHGWLKSGFVSFSSSDMGVRVITQNLRGKRLVDSGTVMDVYSAGLTAPNPSGFWCSKFSVSPALYALCFTPGPPGIPFQSLQFELVNEGSTPGIIYASSAVMIRHF